VHELGELFFEHGGSVLACADGRRRARHAARAWRVSLTADGRATQLHRFHAHVPCFTLFPTCSNLFPRCFTLFPRARPLFHAVSNQFQPVSTLFHALSTLFPRTRPLLFPRDFLNMPERDDLVLLDSSRRAIFD
jgi:hypothetical protein